MKRLILMSALLLLLAGCAGMPMGDGYSNYESGYGRGGGMDDGGFGGMGFGGMGFGGMGFGGMDDGGFDDGGFGGMGDDD